MHALVIDDRSELRDDVAAVVRARGLRVTACGDAESAQAALSADPAEIILLDLGLPGMDGLAFCRWLRAVTTGELPVVIAMTGDPDPETLSAALDAGADDFVFKPIGHELLDIRITIAKRLAWDRRRGAETARKLASSEQQRVDQERLNARRFFALVENLADIVTVIAPDGERKFISQSVERLLGHPVNELTGTDGLSLVHPDDVPLVREAMETVLADEHAHPSVEIRLAHQDGSWRHFEAIATNLIDDPSVAGVVFNSRDITDRIRIAEERREAIQRIRLSFDHAPIGMALLGLDGVCLEANRALAEMSGYSELELVGKRLEELRHDDEPEIDLETLSGLLSGEETTARFERRYVHRDGHEVWVLLSLSAVFDGASRPSYLVAQMLDLSERRRSESALALSEERFRGFAEVAIECVVGVDALGRITEFNPAAERTFGYTRDEVLGRSLELVMPDEYRERHRSGLARYLETRESHILNRRIEIDAIRRSGQRFPVELAIAPIVIGGETSFVGYLRDITERKNMQAAIERSEMRLRALVQNATEVISVFDRQSRRTYVSPAAERVLGYRPEELIGTADRVDIHPDDLEQAAAFLSALRNEPAETHVAEMRLQRRDGDWRWFEMTGMNRLDDPAVAGIIVNARDVTDHKEAELWLAEALTTQVRANDRLTELNQAKSEFISMVSHEFRTPLTSIQGFAEVIADGGIDEPTTKEFAGLIFEESQRLGRLISEMLEFDRLKSHRIELAIRAVNLDGLLEAAIRRCSALSGLHFFERLWERPLPVIEGDFDKLSRLFDNLLSNAVKYSPEGGMVGVGGFAEEDCVHLWVADEGLGIPPGSIGKIFERFSRVENNTHRRIDGTGLGLAIVKQLVELHGGEIWVESEVGAGSTFHVRLPYVQSRTTAETAVTGGAEVNGRRDLLVIPTR